MFGGLGGIIKSWRLPAVNGLVLTLILSDFLTIAASGLFEPVFAVYLTEQIAGGTLAVVGLATTVFWAVKSIVQIPVSWYVDRNDGERDDYAFMVLGTVIASAVPLLYFLFAKEVWHVFALQALSGVGFAMAVPTWLAIFTRHIDKHKEGTEWMLHSNAGGLAIATAAALGGFLADTYGIRVLFPFVSALMLSGALVLLFAKKHLIAAAQGA